MSGEVISLEDRRKKAGIRVLADTSHETVQLFVMEEIAKAGEVLYSEGQWWQFRPPGAWVQLSEETIWNAVRELNGTETREGAKDDKPGKTIKVSSSMCESVCALARARFYTPDAFAKATPGFVSPAGLWTYQRSDGWSVRPARPEDRVRMLVGVDPDQRATALPVRWLDVLQRIWTTPPLPDDATPDEREAHDLWRTSDLTERIAFLHEWIAVVLLGEATQHQVAPILVGDGENGKSVILEVVSSLVPKSLRCSVSPHDLEASAFSSAELVGRALNCVAEIPSTELLSSARIKAIIDGSEQRGERKHENAFIFRPVAGNIFSANGLPPSRDRSHGFWRRWVLLTSPGPKVAQNERVEGLGAIIAASETAAILGLAMRWHDDRVADGRKLTKPRSSVAETERWKVESDNVSQWIEDCCARDEKTGELVAGQTNFAVLYAHYRNWCTANGCQALSSKQYGNRLTALSCPSINAASAKRRPLVLRGGA